jgi:hypothetical protein
MNIYCLGGLNDLTSKYDVNLNIEGVALTLSEVNLVNVKYIKNVL